MSIYSVACIGVAAVFLAMLFKNGKSEYGILISIGVCCVIFLGCLGKLQSVISTVDEIKTMVNIDSKYLLILIKMIGITYVAEFSANMCRDSGYSAIASQIEMFGKLSLLVVSMPVLQALIETVYDMLSWS